MRFSRAAAFFALNASIRSAGLLEPPAKTFCAQRSRFPGDAAAVDVDGRRAGEDAVLALAEEEATDVGGRFVWRFSSFARMCGGRRGVVESGAGDGPGESPNILE